MNHSQNDAEKVREEVTDTAIRKAHPAQQGAFGMFWWGSVVFTAFKPEPDGTGDPSEPADAPRALVSSWALSIRSLLSLIHCVR